MSFRDLTSLFRQINEVNIPLDSNAVFGFRLSPQLYSQPRENVPLCKLGHAASHEVETTKGTCNIPAKCIANSIPAGPVDHSLVRIRGADDGLPTEGDPDRNKCPQSLG